MQLPVAPSPGGVVFVLSGAGLSAASGVPTFRGEGGWWRGHRAQELATPEAFEASPDLVLRFYAMRHEVVRGVRPNAEPDRERESSSVGSLCHHFQLSPRHQSNFISQC